MHKVLIIEDDVDIAAGIADYLERYDHDLDFAYNGRQALDMIQQRRYDIILLDINLPLVNGLEVARTLSGDGITQVPVIVISANDRPDDILDGFNSGVWDYLVKPFHLPELRARMNVALARAVSKPRQVLQRGQLGLDFGTMTLNLGRDTVHLHQTGFDIVRILLEEAPAIIKTRDLYEALWGDHVPESEPLRAHIYKLRQQFKTAFGTDIIQTVRGVGYCIESD